MLKDAVQLTSLQQHFQQPDWTDKTLSNIVVNPLTGLHVKVNTPSMQTPPELRVNKSVQMIHGPMKSYIGRVVRVNSYKIQSSGVIIRMGMHLNQAYPLREYQKFYEPDMGYIIINSKAVSTTRQDEPVAKTPPPFPSHIAHDDGVWDPSSRTLFHSSASSSSLASNSLHWTMHPDLDETFLAAYRSSASKNQD
ncbi:hypothetical protein VKT23_020608 [Stygiomarasmius scandens]|uniref:Uncharacterized protein n=1 Tax=Marasmiellus scandens TaxID=2682957 RepID=A0ABR1IIQ6_9AGAR